MRLRYLAKINPPTPEFAALGGTDEITFVPLEDVWPPPRWRPLQKRSTIDVSSGYTRFRQGDVLVPKITPTFEAGRSVVAVDLPTPVAAGTTELHVVRPTAADARYLNYCFQSRPFLMGGQARMLGVAGQKRVPEAWLLDYLIPVENAARQREIADFLDAETARIDALIEKKCEMIALLDARRRGAVSAAALRGLREHQLRPSRSAFLGDVPKSWDETQLRHLDFSVQTGPFGSQLHAAEYVEGGWPVINPANLVDGKICSDERVSITDERRADLQLHVLRTRDIIFGRRGEMGRAALVTEGEEGWICGTGCLRLRRRGSRLDPKYLVLLLRTPALRAYFSLASVGSTMENLNAEIVLGAPILVPPADEQGEIVEFAARSAETHGAAAVRLERQVDLLRERRETLITTAVTGQLDVAKAVA